MHRPGARSSDYRGSQQKAGRHAINPPVRLSGAAGLVKNTPIDLSPGLRCNELAPWWQVTPQNQMGSSREWQSKSGQRHSGSPGRSSRAPSRRCGSDQPLSGFVSPTRLRSRVGEVSPSFGGRPAVAIHPAGTCQPTVRVHRYAIASHASIVRSDADHLPCAYSPT